MGYGKRCNDCSFDRRIRISFGMVMLFLAIGLLLLNLISAAVIEQRHAGVFAIIITLFWVITCLISAAYVILT